MSTLDELNLKPLDIEQVKRVVNEFARDYVRHDHGAVVFVGSGGGKSTTCRNQVLNSDGKKDFLDADFVYRATEAHPLQPGVNPPLPLPWWDMGDEVCDEIDRRCGLVNEVMIDNGLWALTTSFAPEDKYIPESIIIVLLPWEEHKKRIIQKCNSEHYDAGAKATEEGFKLVQGHRAWAERIAKEKNILLVDSIDKAIEILKSRENF